MKFCGIEKVFEGSFITRYNIHYKTESGADKIYEMISRNHHMEKEELSGTAADAVVIVMHDETGEKILLNREFRMSVNEWVFNFPAGLIDEGETLEEAAARELVEETGLQLVEISEQWKESYSAVGFSNEKVKVVLGKAVGTIQDSHSELEEIEAAWYSKEEVKKILETEMFAARTQAYCMMWCKQ